MFINNLLMCEVSNFWEINYFCPHCNASFWSVEFSKKVVHNGKIKLPPLSDFDNNLKELIFNDRKCKDLIRYYNNIFSFAIFRAKEIHPFKSGIYNLKIENQVYHVSSNTIVPFDNNPRNGQIYIYDDWEATEVRLKDNEQLVRSHIEIISKVLNANPYEEI